MQVEFKNDDLRRLETDIGFNAGFATPIVRGFRKTMRFIRAASDERDLRAMRGLHFKQLQGDRAHQHSLRLNDQWRLIVEIVKAEPKNIIAVIRIEDYH